MKNIFKKGDKVIHILSKKRLTVVSDGSFTANNARYIPCADSDNIIDDYNIIFLEKEDDSKNGLIEIKEEFEIDVKRFKLPIKVERNCPKCDDVCFADLNGHKYLSYPVINKPSPIHMYCGECNVEFEVDVTIRINLEIDNGISRIL